MSEKKPKSRRKAKPQKISMAAITDDSRNKADAPNAVSEDGNSSAHREEKPQKKETPPVETTSMAAFTNGSSDKADDTKAVSEGDGNSSTQVEEKPQEKETQTTSNGKESPKQSSIPPKTSSPTPVTEVTPSDKANPLDEKNSISILVSLVHLVVLAYVIFFIAFFNGSTPSTPPPFRFQYTPQFDTCVSGLSTLFPKQELTLWKQLLNTIKYNLMSSKTVLCQTIITHESDANALNCMLNKVSNCLKTSPFIFTENSISNTPDQLTDQILSRLSHATSDFVIFQNTTNFSHPLPILFHSICDPDYTPYPQSHFYFTLLISDSITVKSSKAELAKVVEKTLLEAWSNPDYKEEEAIASIVRITPVVYYMRHEEMSIDQC